MEPNNCQDGLINFLCSTTWPFANSGLTRLNYWLEVQTNDSVNTLFLREMLPGTLSALITTWFGGLRRLLARLHFIKGGYSGHTKPSPMGHSKPCVRLGRCF
jgi:hypothetical protein